MGLSLFTACGKDSDKDANNSNDSGTNNTSKNKETEKEGLPPNTRVIKVGKTFEMDMVKITLEEVWVSTYTKKNLEYILPEGHVFIFPHFIITNMNEGYKDMKNTDTSRLSFTTIGGCVAYVDGKEYKRTIESLMSYDKTAERGTKRQMDTSVNYGETARVFNAFIVPENWEQVEFVVNHMAYDRIIKEAFNFRYVVNNK